MRTAKFFSTFIFQTIINKSYSTCDFVESETYGRLELRKNEMTPLKCVNNLVFASKEGRKYCMRRDLPGDDKIKCVKGKGLGNNKSSLITVSS